MPTEAEKDDDRFFWNIVEEAEIGKRRNRLRSLKFKEVERPEENFPLPKTASYPLAKKKAKKEVVKNDTNASCSNSATSDASSATATATKRKKKRAAVSITIDIMVLSFLVIWINLIFS